MGAGTSYPLTAASITSLRLVSLGHVANFCAILWFLFSSVLCSLESLCLASMPAHQGKGLSFAWNFKELMGTIKAAPCLTSMQKLKVWRIACFYLKLLQLTMASVNSPWLEGSRPWGSKDGHACLQPFCMVLIGRDILSLLPFYMRNELGQLDMGSIAVGLCLLLKLLKR